MNRYQQLCDLKKRTALLTGAAGRLGRVFADTLASLGCHLILLDKRSEDLAGLQRKLKKKYHVHIECVFCDLEKPEERVTAVKKIEQRTKKLNILINNAALVGSSRLRGWSAPFHQQELETWRRALEVNLTAGFDLVQKLEPSLRRSENGSVINVASFYGIHGPDWRIYKGTQLGNPAAYAVSKAGLIQLTRWLATTLAPHVRVNALAPGGIRAGQGGKFVKNYSCGTPLGRMGEADEIRGALVLLASDLGSYITGQTISIDGGRGIW